MIKRTYAINLNNNSGCNLINWLQDNIGLINYEKTKSKSLDDITDEELHDHNFLIGEGKLICGNGWIIKTAMENINDEHGFNGYMPYKIKFTQKNINQEIMTHFILRWV